MSVSRWYMFPFFLARSVEYFNAPSLAPVPWLQKTLAAMLCVFGLLVVARDASVTACQTGATCCGAICPGGWATCLTPKSVRKWQQCHQRTTLLHWHAPRLVY